MAADIKATYLRCEQLSNPEGIDEVCPRLSWEVVSDTPNTMQGCYRILVASTAEKLAGGQGDLWDSGWVETSQCAHIEYEGTALKAHQQAFWNVILKDANGEEGALSDNAHWSMGMLDQSAWQAKWLQYPVGNTPRAVYFRKAFKVTKAIKRAAVYMTAKGLFEGVCNGDTISEDLFQPGWTDYKQRIYYKTYDLTERITQGENVVGAAIGDGWYRGGIAWMGARMEYGAAVELLAELRIEYADGSVDTIATDDTWLTSTGPILTNDFLNGENYDALQELPGWDNINYDDSAWQKPNTRDVEVRPYLQAYPNEPVRRTDILDATEVHESRPGTYIFNFGQNVSGRVRFTLKAKPGAIVRIRHGEMLNPDKTLYVENLRSAHATDTYVFKSDQEETWEPTFTFHGFQYAELSGIFFDEAPSLDSVKCVAINSDTPRVGHFECSSDMVNQLYSNIVWTQRMNFVDIPTDCPQRDERLGWTGDAQVYIRTAISNMDVSAFFKKWLIDLADTRRSHGNFTNVAPWPATAMGGTERITTANAAWADAAVVCPWKLYECYGDTRVLERHFVDMRHWADHMHATSENGIRRHDRKEWCFGDWLSVEAETPKDLIITAYYAYSTHLTAKAAEVLGRDDEARELYARWETARKAFCDTFLDKDGHTEGKNQTGYVLALHFDLLPDEATRVTVANHLVADIKARNMHLSTGFVGISYLMPALADTGHLDVAYQLLMNETYPSWGYSVVNGATSIWERWNGYIDGEGPGDANMNSFAHYAYGSVGEWLFSTVAGIDHEHAGFETIRIAPKLTNGPMPLTHAKASFRSQRGLITSGWKIEDGTFTLEVTIPANTRALIQWPGGAGSAYTHNGAPLSQSAITVGSGTHVLTGTLGAALANA